MTIWTERKIDCHFHVIDPGRFPYRADTLYRPQGQEIAPYELLMGVFDTFNVRHGLLVGTNSGYGTDLRIILDALRRAEGRLKGIAVVDNTATLDELAALQARGIVGIAFNPSAWGLAHYADCAPLVARAAELGLFVQIQTEKDQLVDMLDLIGPTPARLLIDHCARPVIGAGLHQPGFATALRLGREGRAWVKLSGYAKFSEEAFPHADAEPYLRALVDAYTLDRCVWASDWPYIRAPYHIDFGMMLSLVRRHFPSADDRDRLFWRTPAALLGFDAA